MKANEIISLLGISRATLSNYVKNGKIKAEKKLNGTYEYDAESVYSLLSGVGKRYNVGYVRSSDEKLRGKCKVEIRKFASLNKTELEKIYVDIEEGSRGRYKEIIALIVANKVKSVYVGEKSMLSGVELDILEHIAHIKRVGVIYLSE